MGEGKEPALLAELQESLPQVGSGHPPGHRESVGRELVAAGERVLEGLEKGLHEAKPEAEHHERAVGGGPEGEGGVEGGQGEAEAQRVEEDPCAQDPEEEPGAHMVELEMAELVGQHGHDLPRAQGFEEGVEEHDPLVAEESGEVGVAVGGSARRVHHEKAARPEARPLRQGLDRVLELALGQG